VTTITVVGYLSLDQLVCPAGKFNDVPGGAAYYCAAGAAAAGGAVRLIARAGADYPETALAALRQLGVDTGGVERVAAPSRRSRLHDPSGASRTLPHTSDPEWWEATRRFAPPVPDGDGSFVYTAMPADLLRVQLAARRPGDVRIVDTSPAYARISPAELLALVSMTEVFAPSREETRMLLPGLEDDAALAALAERTGLVLQKRGPDGLALLRRGQAILRAPSRASTVIDTTGAGDSVVGALAVALAAGADDAAILARCSEIAARTVAGVGIAGLLGG
jgi:sugar/nucleoside kinase (ribokinase family)